MSARDRAKKRGRRLDGDQMVRRSRASSPPIPAIDVFVELIGGDDGAAKAAVEAALSAGKHVVTANKALLAKHGVELARLAEKKGVALNFEAAVAGGIPVIKTLREALAGNQIRRVYGILNGTCNYILTQMQEEHRSFADVLKEAQAKGYAEADPHLRHRRLRHRPQAHPAHQPRLRHRASPSTQIDVEGIETHHARPTSRLPTTWATASSCSGVALMTESGIEQRVHPAMVPKHSAIAEVSGVTNCVAIDGDFCGNLLLAGAGAGAKATASAVAERHRRHRPRRQARRRSACRPPSSSPTSAPSSASTRAPTTCGSRCSTGPAPWPASPGAWASASVSLESIVQRRPRGARSGIDARPKPGSPTSVILITHETTEEAIRGALDAIDKDGHVSEKPQMIRIEPL